jgi:hypothetical protein
MFNSYEMELYSVGCVAYFPGVEMELVVRFHSGGSSDGGGGD